MALPKYNPQKALLVATPPTGDRWIHELKLDGFRMGVLISPGNVRIISRNDNDYTTKKPR